MGYVASRFAQMLTTLFLMATLVFLAIRLSPGDPALILLGDVGSPYQYQTLRELMGLNRPMHIQYLDYLRGLFTGDLGRSLFSGEPVTDIISGRIVPTVVLALGTMLGVVLVGVPLGLITAAFVGSLLDQFVRIVSYSLMAVANFWVAIMLIMVFAVNLRWLPSFGYGTAAHMVLPAVSLGLPLLARVVRFVRSGILEVVNSDYVRTARSKGVPHGRVIAVHAFRPTIIPLVTDLGLRLGWLLGGTVIIETVFAWPGLGSLTVQAVQVRDYPVVEACVLLLCGLFLVTNFLVDLSYALLDPRVRHA